MTRFGRIWRVGAALLALSLTAGAPATAQADEASADALERLKHLVPEGQPAAYDIDEADAIYEQLAGLAALTAASGDGGSDSRLSGPCGGFAYSYDDNRFIVDAAADLGDEAPPIDLLDGGQAFTSENPFRVDPDGVVLYYGFSPRDGQGPIDHHWSITTSGGGGGDGGGPNLQGANRQVGVIDVGAHVPFDVSARVEIDGDLVSQNLAACSGTGYVEIVGHGLISAIGILTVAVLVVGLVGLVVHARPASRRHPIRGLLWGLMFGIGLAFALVFSTIIVFARAPVAITIATGMLAGLLWGLLGPPRTPKPEPPQAVTAIPADSSD